MFLQNNSPLHMPQSRDVLLLTQNSDQTLHMQISDTYHEGTK